MYCGGFQKISEHFHLFHPALWILIEKNIAKRKTDPCVCHSGNVKLSKLAEGKSKKTFSPKK